MIVTVLFTCRRVLVRLVLLYVRCTSKKIVFLANTIQLVKQQAEAIKQTLGAIINN